MQAPTARHGAMRSGAGSSGVAAPRLAARPAPRSSPRPASAAPSGDGERTAKSASDRVRLGDSELRVSECCLGTMTFGEQNTKAEAHEQLNFAVHEAGINFLDTAEIYPVPVNPAKCGTTDRYIASWLKDQKRSDIVVATKVSGYGTLERSGHLRDPPRDTRVNAEQIVESVDMSLARLGTDYIDLLQIHWPDRYVPLFGTDTYDIKNEREEFLSFEEQLEGMQKVVAAGKVRYIGVSNETSWGVSEFCHMAKAAGLPKIQTIQNIYNLVARMKYEIDLAETCRRHNVSLLAYSPLAGGSLSNKYNDGGDVTKARLNLFPGYMERYKGSMVQEACNEYAAIAKKYGMTASELAIAFCQSRWFVTSTIIGATSLEQLKHNIGAFEKELPEEALEEIKAVHRRLKDPSISP